MVDELAYRKDCESIKCEILSDGTMYGKDGKVVNENTYKEQCNPKCEKVGDLYYDHKGNIVNKNEYNTLCGTVENPKTGISLPVAFLTIISISGIFILNLTKKHNKFM